MRSLAELDAELGRGPRRLLGRYRLVREELHAAFRRYDARSIDRAQRDADRLLEQLYRHGVTAQEIRVHARTRAERRRAGRGAR